MTLDEIKDNILFKLKQLTKQNGRPVENAYHIAKNYLSAPHADGYEIPPILILAYHQSVFSRASQQILPRRLEVVLEEMMKLTDFEIKGSIIKYEQLSFMRNEFKICMLYLFGYILAGTEGKLNMMSEAYDDFYVPPVLMPIKKNARESLTSWIKFVQKNLSKKPFFLFRCFFNQERRTLKLTEEERLKIDPTISPRDRSQSSPVIGSQNTIGYRSRVNSSGYDTPEYY